jgi:hypothetical protein
MVLLLRVVCLHGAAFQSGVFAWCCFPGWRVWVELLFRVACLRGAAFQGMPCFACGAALIMVLCACLVLISALRPIHWV